MFDKYKNLAQEIFRAVAQANMKEGRDAIPHSDDFIMRMVSTLGVDERIIHELLRLLKESHRILVMMVVKEDGDRKIKRIEGFIDADLGTIHRLRDRYDGILIEMYSETFRKRAMARQIVYELFPKVNQYNNTPMGQILNKVIMLEEFEKLIVKNYTEFTDTWKDRKLDELITENLSILSPSMPASENVNEALVNGSMTKRASDSTSIGDLKDLNRDSLGRVLNIYGVEFFFRVHLRKYQFDYLQELVEKGHISNKSDLQLLKNMIQKVKINADRDQGLGPRMDDLMRLERSVSRFLFSASR